MVAGRVMVVGGTHGNERNAPWLLEAWRRHPALLRSSGLGLELVLGNPAAHAAGLRYLDRDLNRSFVPPLLKAAEPGDRELQRARELLVRHGPEGSAPCLVALDLHSTTAAMGSSLVVYGRRPADLALAAGLQQRLGLPIYLHEQDLRQTGYLVERWPCGLVVEVGPVPQGVIQASTCRQSQLAVEAALEVLAEARAGALRRFPGGGGAPAAPGSRLAADRCRRSPVSDGGGGHDSLPSPGRSGGRTRLGRVHQRGGLRREGHRPQPHPPGSLARGAGLGRGAGDPGPQPSDPGLRRLGLSAGSRL
jgi:hypothetical protein